MAAKELYCLLDVREPWEVALANIAGSVHMPMHEIPARYRELSDTLPIIVLCHAGGRSQRAAEFLVTQGFTQVSNLAGGIDAWARAVDTSVATY